MSSSDAATEYSAGSVGESLLPWPRMSHVIIVWSAERSATVAAYMWEDAAKPWVSRTAGPDPATS